MVPGFALPSPGTVAGCLPPLQVRRGVLGSSLKNGVFLTVPENQNSANAAKTPRAATFSRLPLVRQAAKDGVILAFRGCKKYHRFFQWSPKHHAAPAKEANSRRPYQEKGGQNRGPPPLPSPSPTPLPAPAEKAGGTGDYVIGRRKLNERLLNCGKKIRVGII